MSKSHLFDFGSDLTHGAIWGAVHQYCRIQRDEVENGLFCIILIINVLPKIRISISKWARNSPINCLWWCQILSLKLVGKLITLLLARQVLCWWSSCGLNWQLSNKLQLLFYLSNPECYYREMLKALLSIDSCGHKNRHKCGPAMQVDVHSHNTGLPRGRTWGKALVCCKNVKRCSSGVYRHRMEGGMYSVLAVDMDCGVKV